MNPLLIDWVRWIGVLALEAAVIVGVAWQLQQLTKSALWRRAIGHVCLLSLLLLVVFEFTGTARNLTGWLAKPALTRLDTDSGGVRPSLAAASPVPKQERSLQSAGTLSGEDASSVAAGKDAAGRDAALRRPQSGDGAGKDGPVGRLRTPQRGVPTTTITSAQPNSPAKNIGIRLVPLKSPRAEISVASLCLLAGALLWVAGVVVVVGRMLCGRIALEIFRWRRQQVVNLGLLACVCGLARRLGIRREVRLMESEHICGPVAFGILRPTIGLPVEFIAKFGAEEREVMLAHELAHLAGNDPLWYLLADVLAAVLWWHPLIWWARHRLHTDSELAADEASLLVADGPRVLAECLVEIGGKLAQRRAFRELGVGGNGFRSGLGRRVERLIGLEGGHWRPLDHIRGGLVRTLGPMLLVSATILCTAWVFPPAINQGDSMQIIKQTWRKSLTTLALLTSFGSDINPALAQSAGTMDVQINQNAQADQQKAEMDRVQAEIAKQTAQIEKQAADIEKQASAAAAKVAAEYQSPDGQFQQRLQKIVQSAVQPAASFASSLGAQLDSPERQAVMAKLDKITLDSVKYDGMPLNEVVKNLVELAAAKDPDKVGVNFVLNHDSITDPNAEMRIDPQTGLPLTPQALDLANVVVTINPPLKHVRLIDVLEVITKVADAPISYSVTDYGVVFSAESARKHTTKTVGVSGGFGGGGGGGGFGTFAAASEQLEVRTFKVDTNTFYAGLDRMFGIKLKADSAGQPKETQDALKALMQRLGINMNQPNKSIFYNDVTGIMMVRGTPDDLAVMQATIETLGGSIYRAQGNMFTPPGFGGGGGGFGGRVSGGTQ